MDFLQNLDPNTVTLIVLGCGVLCVVGIVLFFLSQILGVLGGLVTALGGFAADPLSCCGCIVVIALVLMCGGGVLIIANALAACGTPAATNLCTLFGR